MANLQDIINLAKADGGKFFVMDETGEAKLVIMPVEDYEKLLLGKLQKQVKQQIEDVEKINREIIKAQLHEVPSVPEPAVKPPTFMSMPIPARQDLRAEVIDPSFDFEGPKAEVDDL